MEKSIYIFDIDGTIAESGKPVDLEMLNLLVELKKQTSCELALCGGGKFEKACEQVLNSKLFDYIFAECGCDYRKYNPEINQYEVIQEKNIRSHKLIKEFNVLIKHCLRFISEMEYNLGGHMIDIRKGIVYVSLVGMTATDEERNEFIKLDKVHGFRNELISQLEILLHLYKCQNQIQIMIGGAVGITIMPIEHDKVQILDYLDLSVYKLIAYFGDKYEIGGNDHTIMKHPKVYAYKTTNPEHTKKLILNILETNSK
jgi:hydroxymethylpyrimidine pyrophosphatase-like HAD family hydrolase